MNNKTIAIIISSVLAVSGTATYYEVNEAPAIPETHTRYEKVDETTYDKYIIHVSKERLSTVGAGDFIVSMDQAIERFRDNEDEIGRLEFAQEVRANKIAELEKVSEIGVSGATEALSQISQ